MAIYWLPTLDPDETGYFQVDFTDEMDDVGDTISSIDSFAFVDANVYGLQIQNTAIVTGSKKVEAYISNSDAATNRVNVLANSPYTIRLLVTTAGGQTLSRTLGLIVSEDGSDLTVEDGSGLSGADSYASLATADRYHIDLGNIDWDGTDSDRTRKLRRGAQYIDARFRNRFKGAKSTSGQALAWPRAGVNDEDGNEVSSDAVPQAVVDAACEAARMVPYTQKVTASAPIKSVAAGSVSVEFATAKVEREIYDLVEDLLLPYLQPTNRIVRA